MASELQENDPALALLNNYIHTCVKETSTAMKKEVIQLVEDMLEKKNQQSVSALKKEILTMVEAKIANMFEKDEANNDKSEMDETSDAELTDLSDIEVNLFGKTFAANKNAKGHTKKKMQADDEDEPKPQKRGRKPGTKNSTKPKPTLVQENKALQRRLKLLEAKARGKKQDD